MQNEPNIQKSQVNVRPLVIMIYEEKSDWTLGENEPKTNPIKPNSNPNKANVGSLGNLFDHIEIFVFKTKLKY